MQKNSKDKREEHMKVLAEHYAERRNTTKVIEINKIIKYEAIRKTAAKHKWYLKERNGMIRTLLVPDYKIYQILAIIGILAWTALMGSLCSQPDKILLDAHFILMIVWGAFTVWSQLVQYDGWKVLTDKNKITQRLLQRNGTHLSMSGDTPFAQGALAEEIGHDGEGAAVEEML